MIAGIMAVARWMSWNLFLAVLPVAMAYGAAWLGHRARSRRTAWMWLGIAPLLGLWFIFLPNSCYLLTEPIHMLSAVSQDALWPRARHETEAALRLGCWTLVSLIYVSAGALTFALSIRPIQAWWRRVPLPQWPGAAGFFLLMALGVYLGRVVRYNSWDLLQRPSEVFATIGGLANRPALLLGLALFGFFLWLAYLITDIWLDGAAARWQRWTQRASTGPSAWPPLSPTG